MNLNFSLCIIIPVLIMASMYLFIHFKERKELYNKLEELKDCPFKFCIENGTYSPFLIFDLGEVSLYCDYKFGIRSDGIYGIKELELKGINGTWGGHIELNPGQSIFPVISKMKEFEDWAQTKSFKVFWESIFSIYWKNMIRNLSNLNYLETKYKENE